MSPQTVNAYANPLLNEVVFSAAILQPPFFDPNAWYKAFDVKDGSQYLPPEQRIKIW